MGQLSDPYKQGEDDGLEISVSGLPEDTEEPAGDDLAPGDGDLADDEILTAAAAAASDEEDGDDEADDEDDEDNGLDGDEEEIAYELEGWDNSQLDSLFDALDDAEIPFNWDGEELFIRGADEQAVDELIEKVAHPHELAEDDEEGDGGGWLLGELFVVADRLQHDPEEHESVALLLQLANAADEADTPYGLSDEEWNALREKVTALATILEEDKPDADAAIEAAQALRGVTRPYV